ncbi:hypothetical protein B0A55_07784 [Friedmanniomyces simplex]|uniref:Uncharacterized protein n=1 Tax=Friedmanniomyces simplex TaxID=329884 RepID=A0A4V5NES5_9PEZI|nr:hypothetical protein B0A55_07784 [Friedmanniomyces simplex]
MDGTKRSANGKPVPHYTPIDFGATPPWALPPIYHEESALRYTQSPPAGNRTINPLNLLTRSATYARTGPSSATLNDEASNPLRVIVSLHQSQMRRRIGRHSPPIISPLTQDGRDGSDDEIEVDTERDEVYMISTQEGSYSRLLESEDDPNALPDQAVLALQHLKRASELAERQQQTSAGLTHSSTHGGADDGIHQTRHTDLFLRSIVRHIKHRLRAGDTLTVERLEIPAANPTITCAHPLCPAPEREIPSGAYYLTLGIPGVPESAEHYCLFCLENLWNGTGMIAPFPEAAVIARESSFDRHLDGLALGLDGAIDDDRLMAAGLDARSAAETEASTPRSQSLWSGREELGTPATRYGSTGSSSPQSRDSGSTKTGAPSASPIEASALARPIDLGDPPGVDGMSETARPTGRVKLAKKRGVNHGLAVASSKSPLDAEKAAAVPRELRDLSNGFGEAFQDGQVQAAGKRRDSGGSVARRSARLQSVTQDGQGLAAVFNRRAGGEYAENKQSSVVEVTTGAHRQDDATTPKKAQAHAAPRSAETIGEMAAKADRRLEAMYRQRDLALASLGPGESSTVRPPGSRKSAGGPRVGRDAFGVPHTDPFAEHVKYWTRPPVPESQIADAPGSHNSSLVGPVPERLCPVLERVPAASVARQGVVVSASVATGRTLLLPPTKVDFQRMFAFPNTNAETAWPYGLGNAQLDGTNDVPDTNHHGQGPQGLGNVPPQHDGAPAPHEPSSLTEYFGPASLLQSRHAPTLDELRARTPNPLSETDTGTETPGGPYSPSSTTSSGRWKEAPMRFQLLAAYISVGGSLDEREKAAVELWKRASAEQVGWERHLVRAEELRERFRDLDVFEVGHGGEMRGAGPGEVGGERDEDADRGERDGGEDEGILNAMAKARLSKRRDSGNDAGEQQFGKEATEGEGGLEAACGLVMQACRAKDLSTVLGELRMVGDA